MNAHVDIAGGGEDLDWDEMDPDDADEGCDEDGGDSDEWDAEAEADFAALKLRRSRLRAFSDRLLDAVEAIDMPATFLEAERSARAVRCADVMLIQLYQTPQVAEAPAPPAAPRSNARRRDHSDDDMDDDEIQSERRRGAEHFNQGMMQAMFRVFGVAKTRRMMLEPLNRHVHDQAKLSGVWPYGEPYTGEDLNYYQVKASLEGESSEGFTEHPGPWGHRWFAHRMPKVPVGGSP